MNTFTEDSRVPIQEILLCLIFVTFSTALSRYDSKVVTLFTIQLDMDIDGYGWIWMDIDGYGWMWMA